MIGIKKLYAIVSTNNEVPTDKDSTKSMKAVLSSLPFFNPFL